MSDLPLGFYSLFPAQANEAQRVARDEWAAPECPKCGRGKDRFHMFADDKPRYWCRQCDFKGFLDSRKLTPDELARLERERQARQQALALARAERIKELSDQAAYWRGYHDGMQAAARLLWRERGLPDAAQDYFDLGFTNRGGHDALTIPFHNEGWDVETIQYRLLGVDGTGKYRFEKGYGTGAFHTMEGITNAPILIVEGAIKAAVLWWTLCVQGDRPYNVVGVPSKNPGREVLERLAEWGGDHRAIVVLDPDARASEQKRVGAYFNEARYASLPFKVDDMINGGRSPLDIERLYLSKATLAPL